MHAAGRWRGTRSPSERQRQAEHVAIVTGYDSNTRYVSFVGGNQGNAVTRESLYWSLNTYYGSHTILGYGRPNYVTDRVMLTLNPAGGTCSTGSISVKKNEAIGKDYRLYL